MFFVELPNFYRYVGKVGHNFCEHLTPLKSGAPDCRIIALLQTQVGQLMVTPRYDCSPLQWHSAKCQPTVINQQVQPDRNGYGYFQK